MKRPNPFLVAVVAGICGALGCLGVIRAQEKPEDKVQECVYAIVRDFPTYTGTTPLGDSERACKSLTAAQKKQSGKLLADFVDKSFSVVTQ